VLTEVVVAVVESFSIYVAGDSYVSGGTPKSPSGYSQIVDK
jgi:hypothetical protein